MKDEMSHTLYLKQIELGEMANYVYLIGSTRTKEAAVIDPAWEIDRIVKLAQVDEMRLTHILVSSGLVTTMSAGRRWAKVPTSRAVPQAEGWPVREKGPVP